MNSDPAADPVAHTPRFSSSFLLPRYWGTWLLFGVVGFAFVLPDSLRHRIGGGVGDLFRRLNKKRREIARVNIELCFSDRSQAEREQMVIDHFRSYGRGIVDLGLLWFASEKRLDRMTKFNGLQHLLDAIERGDRILMFTPHAPGLDFGGVMVSRVIPTVAMMKSLSNPVQDWLVTRGRCRFQGSVYLRERGLRPLLRAIKENKVCFYMPDEDFGGKQSVFVPFFGVQSSTLTTLGRMAASTGAVVMPCFSRILPGGRGYEVDIDAPMENFPTSDQNENARRMNEALEAGINRAPEQYMWTLRWFKTRPPGEEAFY